MTRLRSLAEVVVGLRYGAVKAQMMLTLHERSARNVAPRVNYGQCSIPCYATMLDSSFCYVRIHHFLLTYL